MQLRHLGGCLVHSCPVSQRRFQLFKQKHKPHYCGLRGVHWRFCLAMLLAIKSSAPFLNLATGLDFADFGRGEFHRMWVHFL